MSAFHPLWTFSGREHLGMRSSRQTMFLTLTFFVWFAAWLIAGTYVSVDFYRFTVGEAAQVILKLLTLLVAIVLAIVPLIRPGGEQASRWGNAASCVCTLAFFALIWRPIMDDVPWDVVKGFGILLDIGTPALLALGAAAAVGEWRLSRFPAQDHVTENSTAVE